MDGILTDLREFSGDAKQFDDITCMALQFIGGSVTIEPYILGGATPGWHPVAQDGGAAAARIVPASRERRSLSDSPNPKIITRPEVFRINLALDELLTNTLEHGFEGRVHEADIS